MTTPPPGPYPPQPPPYGYPVAGPARSGMVTAGHGGGGICFCAKWEF